MRNIATILSTTLFLSTTILPNGVNAQQPDILLVTPQGDILDYVPEAGEVDVRVDGQGRRVLIDHHGRVVAYEVRTDGSRRMEQDRFDPDRGWGFDEAPWDLQPDDEVVTGTLPEGRVEPEQPVTVQPLPAPSHPSAEPEPLEEASIAPQSDTDIPPAIEQKVETLNKGREAMPKLNREAVTALQVLLDRAGFSPGVIDGKMGSNVAKALAAYEAVKGEKLDPANSEEIMQRLSVDGGLPIMSYEISAADAAGPYVASIPSDYAQKAALPAMSYTSTTEMLAERFHMDEQYLKALNPGVDFTLPGAIVKVVNPGEPKRAEVTRIVANKRLKQVQAFDENGELVVAYPATIGSSDTPSPSGTVSVERIALDPNYTYNPKINFQQGGNTSVLTIPPGPNGPVGNVWIALSKPTYGIHGTPDPSHIGKTESHGCIRLTNWDARELAKMIKQGVIVQFVD